jgi:hypothetical protein
MLKLLNFQVKLLAIFERFYIIVCLVAINDEQKCRNNRSTIVFMRSRVHGKLSGSPLTRALPSYPPKITNVFKYTTAVCLSLRDGAVPLALSNAHVLDGK